MNAAISEQQISAVRDMLRCTKNPIGKIPELCGFDNPNYLKTLFKRRYGTILSRTVIYRGEGFVHSSGIAYRNAAEYLKSL